MTDINIEKRAVEDIIGEELYEKLQEKGLTHKKILKIWHKTDETPEEFRKTIKTVLQDEDTQKYIENLDKQIKNLNKQLEKTKNMKHAVLRDLILQKPLKKQQNKKQ